MIGGDKNLPVYRTIAKASLPSLFSISVIYSAVVLAKLLYVIKATARSESTPFQFQYAKTVQSLELLSNLTRFPFQSTGEMIVSSSKYHVQENSVSMYETRMSMIVRKFQKDDVGSYRCIAKNSLGEVDSSIRLYGKFRGGREVVDCGLWEWSEACLMDNKRDTYLALPCVCVCVRRE